MSFPTALSNAVDGVTEIVAAHLNNLEVKVGTDNSAVTTSLDYLLKNVGSIDPGHKHTAGAFSGGNNGDVLYKAAGVWGPGTPEAAGLVAKGGDQSIDGVKTFTSIPLGPGSNPTSDNQLARKAYVDLMTPLSTYISTSSIDPGHKHSQLWASDGSPEAVTVDTAGVATFTAIPAGPGSNPTTDNQLARKAYVDLMLPLAGGAMTGNIAMNSHKVTGLAAASGTGEALRYDEWITAQDPGHKHSKLWASDGSPEAVTVNVAGYVGIGVTNPGAQLDIQASSGACLIGRGVANQWSLQFLGSNTVGQSYGLDIQAGSNSSDWPLYVRSKPDTAALLLGVRGDGNVGIGTTNPGYKLTCNGEPGANGYTAWTNYSDIRFKQDIKSLSGDVLARVLKLNPVTFSYNNKNPWGEKPGERTLYGFIAQELQMLFPEMVGQTQGPDGEKYLTTNLSNLPLYLVQAIKEQQAQIEALQAKSN